MCLYLCLCSCVCYYRSFSCTLYNLQISRPSSYNAKLHSCSFDTLNKGLPFSPFHHATWWYGNFSLNVRGLSNNTKRRETFLWLKKKKFCICFLQEGQSTNETEPYWHSEWGYSIIFTTFWSSRAGVTILFDNNFQFQILKHFAHPRREVYYYRHRYCGQNYDTSKCLRS